MSVLAAMLPPASVLDRWLSYVHALLGSDALVRVCWQLHIHVDQRLCLRLYQLQVLQLGVAGTCAQLSLLVCGIDSVKRSDECRSVDAHALWTLVVLDC